MLLLLHSAFKLSKVKMLLKGEVGGRALNSQGNYFFYDGKSWKNHGIFFFAFEFLWEPCNIWGKFLRFGAKRSVMLEIKGLLVRVSCLWSHYVVFLSKTLYPLLCSGPEVIKLFQCSTQLSMKFQLLIKTKMATNKELYYFKFLRCCIYHANKC